jgi:DNA-directed RNA polymerase subunit beta'
MLRTTLGQLLINSALPEDMIDYTRGLDKKGIKALLSEVAEKHPDRYREIAKKLSDIGRDAAYTTGGQSFGLKHLRTSKVARVSRQRLNQKIDKILQSQLPDDQQEAAILEAAGEEQSQLAAAVLEDAKQNDNPLAAQVLSGSRGNASQLARLIAGDLLYVDHRDEAIPLPVQHSYSEGLPAAEWYGATFGARKGLVDVKFATQDAGFFAKQLNQVAHRLMVVAEDDDDDEDPAIPRSVRGFPVDTTDADNEGALLASDSGGYSRNTVLTPKILQDLDNAGIKRILVRSPAVGGPADGVYSRDVGLRERGGLSPLGDLVGLGAAQALSERLTQGGLNSKHAGGVKGGTAAVSGFQHVNQLIQVPKNFKGGAAHSQEDGTVEAIVPAPQGGQFVVINGQKHYVAPGFDPQVKQGDKVEAGDVISEGIPNPAEIVKHKGIGEGRRYFVRAFTDAYRDAGLGVHRRNVELMSRALIDHVELLDEDDEHSPGDVVPYNQLEKTWTPRAGYVTVKPKQAVGKYLERPALHYSIGTRVRPSMLRDFDEFGVDQLDVHDQLPPFQPMMSRAMSASQHDPDWLTRMLGSGQKKSLLSAARLGGTSDTTGTSFVPALAEGVNFGNQWPQSVLRPAATPRPALPKGS